jgi:Flp pilus assembly protein TadG
VDRKRILVSFARQNHGQSVVEFALVLPLLLVLLIGITEFGRAWMTVNVLTSAAREGARLAVVTAPDIAAVTARVREVCTSAGIKPGSIKSITVTPPAANDPDRRVTVTVEVNFAFIGQNIMTLVNGDGLIHGTIPLRATSVMRHESL